MPPINDHLTGEKWRECALCGFEYPVSQLWKRNGQIVCREACQDENLVSQAEPMPPELVK